MRGVIHIRVTLWQVALLEVAAVDILPSLSLCELISINILRGLAADVKIYGIQRVEDTYGLQRFSLLEEG